jgi:hypothetical protein
MKRMNKVTTSLTLECENVPNIYWLRYNPNSCHIDGNQIRVSMSDREAWLNSFLLEFELDSSLQVGYACYDSMHGELDVLHHPDFHPWWKEVSVNLTPNFVKAA